MRGLLILILTVVQLQLARFASCAAASTNNTAVYKNIRVTVHTPALLRLEWSASGIFEDRPSLAFVNRNLSTCSFAFSSSSNQFSLTTPKLNLTYFGDGSAPFSPKTLSIAFTVSGHPHTWSPGGPGTMACGLAQGQDRVDCGVVNVTNASCVSAGCCFDANPPLNYDEHIPHCYRPSIGSPANLLGSVDTMDCDLKTPEQCNKWYRQQLNQGLVSRDGWVLVDETGLPVLNSSDFANSLPWRVDRPWSSDYQDWYFFGHGHEYRQALLDFSLVSGPINLMDIQAYGVWHSRYYPYSTNQYTAVVEKYSQLNLPLHVAVLDMDWHIEPSTAGCDSYGGYVWNKKLFPDPAAFTSWLHQRGLKSIINTHDATGVDHCQGPLYSAVATKMGLDPSTNTTVQCQLQDAHYESVLYSNALQPLADGSVSSVDWIWTGHCNHFIIIIIWYLIEEI